MNAPLAAAAVGLDARRAAARRQRPALRRRHVGPPASRGNAALAVSLATAVAAPHPRSGCRSTGCSQARTVDLLLPCRWSTSSPAAPTRRQASTCRTCWWCLSVRRPSPRPSSGRRACARRRRRSRPSVGSRHGSSRMRAGSARQSRPPRRRSSCGARASSAAGTGRATTCLSRSTSPRPSSSRAAGCTPCGTRASSSPRMSSSTSSTTGGARIRSCRSRIRSPTTTGAAGRRRLAGSTACSSSATTCS